MEKLEEARYRRGEFIDSAHRFRVCECLGAGAFAELYLVFDTENSRNLAAKCEKPPSSRQNESDRRRATRLHKEAVFQGMLCRSWGQVNFEKFASLPVSQRVYMEWKDEQLKLKKEQGEQDDAAAAEAADKNVGTLSSSSSGGGTSSKTTTSASMKSSSSSSSLIQLHNGGSTTNKSTLKRRRMSSASVTGANVVKGATTSTGANRTNTKQAANNISTSNKGAGSTCNIEGDINNSDNTKKKIDPRLEWLNLELGESYEFVEEMSSGTVFDARVKPGQPQRTGLVQEEHQHDDTSANQATCQAQVADQQISSGKKMGSKMNSFKPAPRAAGATAAGADGERNYSKGNKTTGGGGRSTNNNTPKSANKRTASADANSTLLNKTTSAKTTAVFARSTLGKIVGVEDHGHDGDTTLLRSSRKPIIPIDRSETNETRYSPHFKLNDGRTCIPRFYGFWDNPAQKVAGSAKFHDATLMQRTMSSGSCGMFHQDLNYSPPTKVNKNATNTAASSKGSKTTIVGGNPAVGGISSCTEIDIFDRRDKKSTCSPDVKADTYPTGRKCAFFLLEVMGRDLCCVRKKVNENHQLSIPAVGFLGKQLIQMLQMIHEEGVLHRDIKPQNCMLGNNNQTKMDLHLVDFGLATQFDLAQDTLIHVIYRESSGEILNNQDIVRQIEDLHGKEASYRENNRTSCPEHFYTTQKLVLNQKVLKRMQQTLSSHLAPTPSAAPGLHSTFPKETKYVSFSNLPKETQALFERIAKQYNRARTQLAPNPDNPHASNTGTKDHPNRSPLKVQDIRETWLPAHYLKRRSRNVAFRGTAAYGSISALEGYEQTRWDDIEGAFWVMFDLLLGGLSWRRYSRADMLEREKKEKEERRRNGVTADDLRSGGHNYRHGSDKSKQKFILSEKKLFVSELYNSKLRAAKDFIARDKIFAGPWRVTSDSKKMNSRRSSGPAVPHSSSSSGGLGGRLEFQTMQQLIDDGNPRFRGCGKWMPKCLTDAFLEILDKQKSSQMCFQKPDYQRYMQAFEKCEIDFGRQFYCDKFYPRELRAKQRLSASQSAAQLTTSTGVVDQGLPPGDRARADQVVAACASSKTTSTTSLGERSKSQPTLTTFTESDLNPRTSFPVEEMNIFKNRAMYNTAGKTSSTSSSGAGAENSKSDDTPKKNVGGNSGTSSTAKNNAPNNTTPGAAAATSSQSANSVAALLPRALMKEILDEPRDKDVLVLTNGRVNISQSKVICQERFCKPSERDIRRATQEQFSDVHFYDEGLPESTLSFPSTSSSDQNVPSGGGGGPVGGGGAKMKMKNGPPPGGNTKGTGGGGRADHDHPPAGRSSNKTSGTRNRAARLKCSRRRRCERTTARNCGKICRKCKKPELVLKIGITGSGLRRTKIKTETIIRS
ncbi:unnamed protein product [Amoebophrya sp. A120]|nr:unnamed protein product [Amoebophrya sp. A120]|eukprot:GSA120T00013687001.1